MHTVYSLLYSLVPTLVEIYNVYQIKKSFNTICNYKDIQQRYRIPEVEDSNIRVTWWGTLYLYLILPLGVRSNPDRNLAMELETLNYVLYGSGMHGLISTEYDVYYGTQYDVYQVRYSPIFKRSSLIRTSITLGIIILGWIYKESWWTLIDTLWK